MNVSVIFYAMFIIKIILFNIFGVFKIGICFYFIKFIYKDFCYFIVLFFRKTAFA